MRRRLFAYPDSEGGALARIGDQAKLAGSERKSPSLVRKVSRPGVRGHETERIEAPATTEAAPCVAWEGLLPRAAHERRGDGARVRRREREGGGRVGAPRKLS